MKLVLFGVKGSGKDTTGRILIEQWGFAQWAFADPLKRAVLEAYPKFDPADMWGTSERRERQYKEYPFTGPCLVCNSDVRFADGFEFGNCVKASCNAQYPRYLSPRIAAQTLGTEWGRRLYRNTWIDNTFDRIEMSDSLSDDPGRHVITDGRFNNELERSRERGAKVVLLTRGLAASTSMHPSEAELRKMAHHNFDGVIYNESMPLADLPDAVGDMMRDLWPELMVQK